MARARAQAEVHRRLMAFENRATPQEFSDLLRQETRGIGSAFGAALRGSVVAQDLALFDRLEQFQPVEMGDGATLYRGAAATQGRGLLVALTGRMQRLSLPTPIFLQRVPAAEWDVLMLRDPLTMHFRLGSPGFADSLPGLAQRVKDMARSYRRTLLFGNSMGGLPAVQIALMAGDLRAVSVGAQPQSDIMRLFRVATCPPAYDPVCACLSPRRRDLMFYHAEGHADDSTLAGVLACKTGGVAVPVPGTSRHSTISELWQDGRLGAFIAAVLAGQPFTDDFGAELLATGPAIPLAQRDSVIRRILRALRR